MKALQIHAGPRALRVLRERGLQAADIHAIPGAAGGPKGLILGPLDRFLFSDWLANVSQPVHLLGASIGAWRLATACLNEPRHGFERMAHDYIHQQYEHAPGKSPTPKHVSEVFGATLASHLRGREAEVLGHPHFRLHVFTSRGRKVLSREGLAMSKLTTPLGYAAAFVSNAFHRRALGDWLERVVFSDSRDAPPMRLDDYPTRSVPLTPENLRPSILASCSIPFWLDAVRDIPGAPRGAYWDGGLTDYHLALDYASMNDGLVLYPHFQKSIVPGWLDKAFERRHQPGRHLDNVVVLSPTAEWIASLPNGKLPDRSDFHRYGDDLAARVVAWSRAVAESQRLCDEFAAMANNPPRIDVQPL